MHEAPPALAHREVLVILGGVLLGMFLAALDQTIVSTALPTITGELHGGEHLSWVVSAYLLTSTASTPIYGRLGDLYGRRRMVLIAISVFLVASALCGLAQSMGQLIAARALQGAGGGGLVTLAQATVGDVVAPRERGRYQAYIAGTWATASVGGPVLGGFFVDYADWRWVFWINLPIGLFAFLVCYRALRRLPVRRGRVRIDYVGAALLTAAVAALLLASTWGGSIYPWSSPPVLGLIAAGLALLALFVVWELRVDEPIVPMRLFLGAIFRIANLSSFMTSMAMFGAAVFLPLFLQVVMRASPSHSGLLMLPFSASTVVGALIAGQTMSRIGRYKLAPIAGLTMATLALVLMSQMTGSSPQVLALLWEAMIGTGVGMTMPSMLVAVQNAVDRGDIGAASSAVAFFRSLGGAFGVGIMGSVLFAALEQRLGGAAAQLGPAILRDGPAAVLGLAEPARSAAIGAFTGSFHIVFLSCAGLMALSLAVMLFLEEIPLRGRG